MNCLPRGVTSPSPARQGRFHVALRLHRAGRQSRLTQASRQMHCRLSFRLFLSPTSRSHSVEQRLPNPLLRKHRAPVGVPGSQRDDSARTDLAVCGSFPAAESLTSDGKCFCHHAGSRAVAVWRSPSHSRLLRSLYRPSRPLKIRLTGRAQCKRP